MYKPSLSKGALAVVVLVVAALAIALAGHLPPPVNDSVFVPQNTVDPSAGDFLAAMSSYRDLQAVNHGSEVPLNTVEPFQGDYLSAQPNSTNQGAVNHGSEVPLNTVEPFQGNFLSAQPNSTDQGAANHASEVPLNTVDPFQGRYLSAQSSSTDQGTEDSDYTSYVSLISVDASTGELLSAPSTFDHIATSAGTVPVLVVAKGAGNVIQLSWLPSCGAAEEYGVYEGQIGVWYSHTRIDCFDEGGDRTELISTSPGDRYYLVVPRTSSHEGSYCKDSAGHEGPVGFATCVPQQVLVPCGP